MGLGVSDPASKRPSGEKLKEDGSSLADVSDTPSDMRSRPLELTFSAECFRLMQVFSKCSQMHATYGDVKGEGEGNTPSDLDDAECGLEK